MEYRDINDYELLYLISDVRDEETVYLLEKYEPLIQKKCRKWEMILKKLNMDTEDLEQEIKIVFLQAIKNFKEEKNAIFYTYVSTVIDARIKSLIRSLNSNKNIISSNCISLSSLYFDREIDEFIKDERVEVEKTVENLELEDKVYEFLYQLPLDKAFIFELYLNHYSVPMISKFLDKDGKTVRSVLRSCRKKMKDYLYKFDFSVL